jgi:hypothetical protein
MVDCRWIPANRTGTFDREQSPARVFASNSSDAGVPTTPRTYTFGIRVDDGSGTFAVRDATVEVTSIRALGALRFASLGLRHVRLRRA